MPALPLPATVMHVEDTGAGEPPLMFVHGALCDHTNWRPQVAHFARRHRVLAPDLHGHGASDRTPGRIGVHAFGEDLVALCDAAGIERAVWVGHSMGCRALLEVWRRAPARVAALVFVDGAYLVPSLLGAIDPRQREDIARRSHERAAALYRDVEPAVRARHGFAQMFFDERFAAERDAIVAAAASLPSHVARELMPDFAAWDARWLEPVLATVTVPVLAFASTYMNAEHRRVTLAEGVTTPWLDALAAHAPHAEVHRHHGAGHFLMLEQPDAVNAAIDTFLDRHHLR